MKRLSKRDVHEDDFIKDLSDYNRTLGNVPTIGNLAYPLQKFVSKGGFQQLQEKPELFVGAMKQIVEKIVSAFQERAPGMKKGLTDFYQRVGLPTLDLLSSAHRHGIIPFPYVKLWTLQITNEMKPGSPFEKDIEKAKEEVGHSEKHQ